MDLSVVILNWNTCALLEKCLESLKDTQPGLTYEVVVVDNASEDDSREMVTTHFPHVRLLVNPKNIGFGAGNNVAVPQTTGRYILFLNSDTVVREGALTALVRYADAAPDIGVLGPKLLNPDGSLQYSCRRYPTLGAGFFRNTPLGRLFPNNRFATDYLMQDWDHASPRDVDWVSGAALMIRRTLVDKIGAFDDDFYMYCEDVDLCWRANHEPLPGDRRAAAQQNAGAQGSASGGKDSDSVGAGQPPTWRVTYYPDAVITHHIGKSSDQVPTRMTYEFHRSQYLFYKKHYAHTMPIFVRPLVPLGILLRASGQILRYRYRYWKKRLFGPKRLKTKTHV